MEGCSGMVGRAHWSRTRCRSPRGLSEAVAWQGLTDSVLPMLKSAFCYHRWRPTRMGQRCSLIVFSRVGRLCVWVGGCRGGGGLRWQRPCGELCQLAFRGPKTDRPRSVERVRVGCKTGANAQPCSCTLRPRRRRARYYYYYCIYARRTQGHAGHAAEQAYAVLNERVGGCWWWW